jgi:plasmid stabilization system protein ParE
MKRRYTLSAADELDRSVGYLIAHAPQVAGDFVENLDRAIDELLEYPYSAPETDKVGVRRKYIARFRYSIFYAVDSSSDELVILSIRHAARRWPWQD